MKKRTMKSQLGFTLMEILAVVVVISIILGIGVPFVNNLVKDSSTQDFVSNAKTLEDAAHMYYRDEGKLPTTEVITEISDDSKLVIKSELLKAGVIDPDAVIAQLLTDGAIKKISYADVKEYTRVAEGDEGTEEFIIIDSADISTGNYGVYENDLSGFVFSSEVRENSSGVIYSGSYKVDDKEEMKAIVDEPVDPSTLAKGNEMTPYGLRLLSVNDNKNGTADVKVTWTNRVVGADNKELRGYLITDFDFNCTECSNVVENSDGTFGATLTADISQKTLNLSLKGDKVKYGSVEVIGTPTNEATLVIDIVKEINNPNSLEIINVNDTLDEVIGGDLFEDRNDLYDQLEETNFDSNKVSAVEVGFEIKGLEIGNYIVLKELRKTGNIFDFDSNRTRLFISKKVDILIPKSPYLQDDFQKNPESTYEYIIEVYKDLPCTSCSSKTAPSKAVSVYYAN
jgi:prepilin-type N-terminal cleavage/methylation domain-containing protein